MRRLHRNKCPRSRRYNRRYKASRRRRTQPSTAAAAVDPGPSRAELQKTRESLALLNNRATAVRSSLESLKRAQAAQGYNIGGQYTGPAGLMDTYLNGATEALNAHDLSAAKDFAAKAERQIEILEKLFHL